MQQSQILNKHLVLVQRLSIAIATMAFSSKQVVHTEDIRLDKAELCRRYSHYGQLSGVCSQRGAVTGNEIDHIIELQMIVKALRDEMTPEYTRDTCTVKTGVLW